MREAMESWRGEVLMLNTCAQGLLFGDDAAITVMKKRAKIGPY